MSVSHWETIEKARPESWRPPPVLVSLVAKVEEVEALLVLVGEAVVPLHVVDEDRLPDHHGKHHVPG
jgi:hypothetical protein